MEQNQKKVITTTTTTVVTEEVVESKKSVETHYLLIVDESGSMSTVHQATINTVNEQIQTLKSLEKKFPDQKYYISLIAFNTNAREVFMNIPASEAKEITSKDYEPNGGTALLDAMGLGLTRLEDKVRPLMTDPNKIATAVVVVITDGEENSSHEWKGDKIKILVERLNKDDKWTISYVGANQDAIMASSKLGIYAGNSVNYNSTSRGVDSVNAALYTTMSMRASGISNGAYSFVGGGISNSSFLADYGGTIDENQELPKTDDQTNDQIIP